MGTLDRVGASGGAVATDTLWDTKGDLAVATGADAAAKVAVGAAGTHLVTDGQTSSGLNWALEAVTYDLPTGAIAATIMPRGTFVSANINTLLSQQLYMAAIWLPSNRVITSISVVSGTTALATGVNQLFGLYDSSRNLLRGSNDDTSTAWAANTVKTLNLTSTYTTTVAGFFYLGILVNATTVPSLKGLADAAGGIHSLAPILHGTSTGSITALPNPAAAITFAAQNPYAYVS
ncbi:MAG TPA: hypothetical protein VGR13_03400 [Actinomycetota bacterium]|nr:hypothetical protein [Actinomycetota bacterium]